MAETRTLTARHINATLRELEAVIPSVSSTVALWPTWDEDVQVDFSLEWDELMDRFESLVDLDAGCHLEGEQHSRLVELIRTYERVLPLAERLELYTIPVPHLTAK